MLESCEHCAMAAEMVVTYEQVAGKRLVVEITGEVPHHLLDVVAIVKNFPCEVFLAVIHTSICIVHIIQVLGLEPFQQVVNSIYTVIVAQLATFKKVVKFFFAHALATKRVRYIFAVLIH